MEGKLNWFNTSLVALLLAYAVSSPSHNVLTSQQKINNQYRQRIARILRIPVNDLVGEVNTPVGVFYKIRDSKGGVSYRTSSNVGVSEEFIEIAKTLPPYKPPQPEKANELRLTDFLGQKVYKKVEGGMVNYYTIQGILIYSEKIK